MSKKHGLWRTKFYRTFENMNRRCKKVFYYSGVKVLWKSFEEFRDDMYESYLIHVKNFGEHETTIDRIDNDDNYYQENCRWATRQEQSQNRGIPKNNTTGFKGLCLAKSGYFRVEIKAKDKRIYVGYFKDKFKAAEAYNKAALKYHGEFANLNKF